MTRRVCETLAGKNSSEATGKPQRELAAMHAVEGCDDDGLIALALIRSDGSSLAIQIGPAEAIAVAGELIQAARARMGRLDWPPATIAENAR